MFERCPGSVFQIVDATDENDLEIAMEVLRKGTHTDKDEEDRSDRTGANREISVARYGGLLKLQHHVSDGSHILKFILWQMESQCNSAMRYEILRYDRN